MEHELRSLHSKVIHAAKKRDETLRRQFTRAQAQAFPHGHPQERTLGVVYFLNRYGPGLVDLLLEELPIDLGQHWLVTSVIEPASGSDRLATGFRLQTRLVFEAAAACGASAPLREALRASSSSHCVVRGQRSLRYAERARGF